MPPEAFSPDRVIETAWSLAERRVFPSPQAFAAELGLSDEQAFNDAFAQLDPDERGRVAEQLLAVRAAVIVQHGLPEEAGASGNWSSAAYFASELEPVREASKNARLGTGSFAGPKLEVVNSFEARPSGSYVSDDVPEMAVLDRESLDRRELVEELSDFAPTTFEAWREAWLRHLVHTVAIPYVEGEVVAGRCGRFPSARALALLTGKPLEHIEAVFEQVCARWLTLRSDAQLDVDPAALRLTAETREWARNNAFDGRTSDDELGGTYAFVDVDALAEDIDDVLRRLLRTWISQLGADHRATIAELRVDDDVRLIDYLEQDDDGEFCLAAHVRARHWGAFLTRRLGVVPPPEFFLSFQQSELMPYAWPMTVWLVRALTEHTLSGGRSSRWQLIALQPDSLVRNVNNSSNRRLRAKFSDSLESMWEPALADLQRAFPLTTARAPRLPDAWDAASALSIVWSSWLVRLGGMAADRAQDPIWRAGFGRSLERAIEEGVHPDVQCAALWAASQLAETRDHIQALIASRTERAWTRVGDRPAMLRGLVAVWRRQQHTELAATLPIVWATALVELVEQTSTCTETQAAWSQASERALTRALAPGLPPLVTLTAAWAVGRCEVARIDLPALLRRRIDGALPDRPSMVGERLHQAVADDPDAGRGVAWPVLWSIQLLTEQARATVSAQTTFEALLLGALDDRTPTLVQWTASWLAGQLVDEPPPEVVRRLGARLAATSDPDVRHMAGLAIARHRLLTSQQLAPLVGVSDRTIANAVRDGRIEADALDERGGSRYLGFRSSRVDQIRAVLNPSDVDDWLTLGDAAKRVGMSRTGLRKRILAGDIPARTVRRGKYTSYYIDPARLDAIQDRLQPSEGESWPTAAEWAREVDVALSTVVKAARAGRLEARIVEGKRARIYVRRSAANENEIRANLRFGRRRS